MAYTIAEFLVDFRDHLGDYAGNIWTDWQLLGCLRRACEACGKDFYQEVRDDSSYTRYATVGSNVDSVLVPTAFKNGEIFNIYGRVNQYQPGVAFSLAIGTPTVFNTTTAHGFSVNQQIQLDGLSTNLPGGFANFTGYYIKTVPNSTSFTLSATSGGTVITATSSGSGYAGNYVNNLVDYDEFNQWWKGIRIDPLTESNPRIRFAVISGYAFEMRIEGSAQLRLPTTVVASTNGSAILTVTDGTYIPVVGDTFYFQATAPTGFPTPSTSLTPITILTAPTSTTFTTSVTATSVGNFKIHPLSQTIPSTDYNWLCEFLRFQGEAHATRERQRSGNLDRRAMAQRRLLAEQNANDTRSHRMQPHNRSIFYYAG